MLAGCVHDGQTVHQVSAQHLVLDLDLVERQEERIVADKQRGGHQVRMRVEEASCGKGLTTLLQGQRRVLLDTCSHAYHKHPSSSSITCRIPKVMSRSYRHHR